MAAARRSPPPRPNRSTGDGNTYFRSCGAAGFTAVDVVTIPGAAAFALRDGTMIHVTTKFLQTFMCNGVFNRLIGRQPADAGENKSHDLTTGRPRRDSQGRLLVLVDYDIEPRLWYALLQFFRCCHIQPSLRNAVYDMALTFGGFHLLDLYMSRCRSRMRRRRVHPNVVVECAGTAVEDEPSQKRARTG
jgi:hypothetical protein